MLAESSLLSQVITTKFILVVAGIMGGLSVVLGAFGAHALKAHLASDMLAVFNTGVKYQGLHACALLFLGLITLHSSDNAWRLAALLMVLGIVLFSTSLYGLALGGPRWLGPITPLGGLSFILAWCSIVFASFRLDV